MSDFEGEADSACLLSGVRVWGKKLFARKAETLLLRCQHMCNISQTSGSRRQLEPHS
jgi:hypothetical protein